MSKNIGDDDLLKLYQNIRQNTENSVEQARNSAALSYLTSVNRLDNKSTCVLLEQNLKKLSTIINNENLNDTKIQNILSKQPALVKRERQSTLDKLDFNSLITKLNCSNSITCTKSENTSEAYFQEFLSVYNEKRKKKPIVETKSFAPQSCNSKDRRFGKQPGEMVRNFGNKKTEEKSEGDTKNQGKFGFKTAREELGIQRSKIGSNASSSNAGNANVGGQKRKLGHRRGVGNKFVSPMLSNDSSEETSSKSEEWIDEMVDERLKNIDPRMVELIKSEIMDCGAPIEWNDIAGLDFAKNAIQEAVVWPMLRPDIFTGLRRPPKGILLFGPPGTGKTLIGKCVASQSKSTFFSISASSLTSKWVGDGEKMVRALFAVARCHQPAVIFIDEIDSLLSQRSDTEHESSRRIKTEFLVQLDGATTDNEERLLVIGATNRPQELDEAARRRFVKRLYIPLPELEARYQLVKRLMSNERHELSDGDLTEIAKLSNGYSGADMRNLCADASMGPIRCIGMTQIQSIQSAEVRAVNKEDFRKALNRVRSSVSPDDLNQYIVWDKTYGSGSFC